MKFFPQLRLPSYGCGSAGQSCDWKGFAGRDEEGLCCFTCTDLERTFNVQVIDLRVLDILSCLSRSLASRSANHWSMDQLVAEAGSWRSSEDKSGEEGSAGEARTSFKRAEYLPGQEQVLKLPSWVTAPIDCRYDNTFLISSTRTL
jgi:hypothetical protein